MKLSELKHNKMNREIKFRGKRKLNWEWVYGSLIAIGNDWCQIVPLNIEYDAICEKTIRVISETIGQLTGLKDKKGKEAYVGNIYKDDKNNLYKIFEVKGGFAINIHQDDFYRDPENIPFYEGLSDMQTASWFESTLEEIGNIYENAELLIRPLKTNQ